MATGTKRQAQETVGQQEDGQTASDSSQSQGRQRRSTRGGGLRAIAARRQQQGGLKNMDAQQLARGLGWFSIGLGLAEVLTPRAVANISGIRGNTGLIRLFGLREIASGIAIFMQRKPAAAVWSRVAGDALDLTCLAVAAASPESRKGRVAFATANVLGVTALDIICAQQLSSENDGSHTGAAIVSHSLVINRPAEELYQFWRNFENLPSFMHHLELVRASGDGRSHWVAKAPAGTSVEWDAEITEDRPNQRITWRSVEGADVDNSGSVSFERAPGGRGTIVRVEIEYSPPGGVIGAAIAKLFGEEPEQQVSDDLRRFKQVMETGEVVLSEATIRGTGLSEQRPGQPPSE